MFGAWVAVAYAGGLPEWGGNAIAVRERAYADKLLAGDAVSITAGEDHTCAITSCGAIECWGADDVGQLSDAPGGSGFEQISAGGDHTCALTDTNKVVCWGDDSQGQSSPPSATYRRIAAGDTFTCGVKTDRSIECWGDTAGLVIPSGNTFGRIAAGDGQVCAYNTARDTMTCFGEDGAGQASPPAQPSDFGFLGSRLAGGRAHTCGIAGGRLGCFGDDGAGQISATGFFPSAPSTPWATAQPDYPGLWQFPGMQWMEVDAGGAHTCGINLDVGSTELYCWGDGSDGQTAAPKGSFNAVATGGRHSCAIEEDGDVVCWGADDFRQASAPVLSPLCSVVKWGTRWSFLVLDE
ncbi:MAG: hypothetical protein ABMA64_00775 [Myxococcota bacterium]